MRPRPELRFGGQAKSAAPASGERAVKACPALAGTAASLLER
jgi:hypothetical protein